MEQDISAKLLAQTSDNIQKLFDLTTRIDERVKSIQHKQSDINDRVDSVVQTHIQIMQKIAVLESKHEEDDYSKLSAEINSVLKDLTELDKRITFVESVSGTQQERWKTVTNFVIQLIWIVLAAWVLMKLNLQAPP